MHWKLRKENLKGNFLKKSQNKLKRNLRVESEEKLKKKKTHRHYALINEHRHRYLNK
jgi:hypothetical protein